MTNIRRRSTLYVKQFKMNLSLSILFIERVKRVFFVNLDESEFVCMYVYPMKSSQPPVLSIITDVVYLYDIHGGVGGILFLGRD